LRCCFLWGSMVHFTPAPPPSIPELLDTRDITESSFPFCSPLQDQARSRHSINTCRMSDFFFFFLERTRDSESEELGLSPGKTL
jgi:hypothetical protein